MAPPLLTLQNIFLSFGGNPLLSGAELVIGAGEFLCLVGRNGSGKSTLLKIAAGLVEADQGERFVQPGTTIRYLAQEPNLERYETIQAYVAEGLGPADDPYRAFYFLEQLGLTGSENPGLLSGGELRRAALARALAPQPDILLLDEPTNHLDLPTIEWLETELKGSKSACVLISHDRRFLEALSQETIWLDRGITRRLSKGFSAFEEWRDALLAQEESDAHKLDRKLVAEADWLRYGVTARRKRNVRRLAQLHALRKKRSELRFAPGKATLTVNQADTSGTLVIEAEQISKSFDSKQVVKNFSLRLLRGDRIGLVGANGTGKTTLLKMLSGELAPDSGTVTLGSNVEMVLIDQKRESLDPNATVSETLTGGRSDMVTFGNTTKHVIGYMKDFLFTPEQAKVPARVLSGGERNRLLIARALARPSNLLVLDEPTNDLDLETLDLLQEMIAEYSGTVLLVSHDRDFLDKTVCSIVMSEEGGLWREYAGGYTDMLAQRGRGVEKVLKQKEGRGSIENKQNRETVHPVRDSQKKRKLSFHEQRELQQLPKKMNDLEQRISVLQQLLSDSSLYEKKPEQFHSISQELVQNERELEQAEERWLELEVLKEGFDNSIY